MKYTVTIETEAPDEDSISTYVDYIANLPTDHQVTVLEAKYDEQVVGVKFENGPANGKKATLALPLKERVKVKGSTYRLIPDPWTGENTTYFHETAE